MKITLQTWIGDLFKPLKIQKMKTFEIRDTKTNEIFICRCEPYKIHNLHTWNKEFIQWYDQKPGRIIFIKAK